MADDRIKVVDFSYSTYLCIPIYEDEQSGTQVYDEPPRQEALSLSDVLCPIAFHAGPPGPCNFLFHIFNNQ